MRQERMADQLLNSTMTAQILGISVRRVQQLVSAGRLSVAVEVPGRMLLFFESEVYRFRDLDRPPGRPPIRR